jgi:uncharacterized protein HemX
MSFDIEPGRSDPGRTETRYAPDAPAAAPVQASVAPPAPSVTSEPRQGPSRIVMLIVAVIAIGLVVLAARLIMG